MTATERDGGQLIRSTLPAVAARLPGFLPAQRWFGGKERAVDRVEIRDTAVISDHPSALLAVIEVHTGTAVPAAYFLPLGLADPASSESPGEVIVRHDGLVVRDAIGDPDTCRALLRGIVEGRTLRTANGGKFVFRQASRPADTSTSPFDAVDPDTVAVRHVGVEQSNSSVIFGSSFILKALRRLTAGTNPEIEISAFLGEYTTFDRYPALIGWAEYHAPDGSSAPVGVLQRFVPNQGDGWAYVLRTLHATPPLAVSAGRAGRTRHVLVDDMARLGQTLAGFHLALASRSDVPDFAPEPFSGQDVEQWRQRTVASLDEALARVERGLQHGPTGTGWSAIDRQYGAAVRDGAGRLRATIDGIGALSDGAVVKTRHHGDFHLGQTLVAPDGWIIIDFEGEPLRSLEERRARQTPLRDVAGVLRSLDYARATVSRQARARASSERSSRPGSNQDAANAALDVLFAACREALLAAYVEAVRAGGAPLLPARPSDLTRALTALEVEKALYELAYELGNRPDWVSIPLSALARLAQDA